MNPWGVPELIIALEAKETSRVVGRCPLADGTITVDVMAWLENTIVKELKFNPAGMEWLLAWRAFRGGGKWAQELLTIDKWWRRDATRVTQREGKPTSVAETDLLNADGAPVGKLRMMVEVRR